jgi:hypothetical protein
MSRFVIKTDIELEYTARDEAGVVLDLRSKDKIELLVVDSLRNGAVAGPYTVDPLHAGNDLEHGVVVVDIPKEDTDEITCKRVVIDMQITEGSDKVAVVGNTVSNVVDWFFTTVAP